VQRGGERQEIKSYASWKRMTAMRERKEKERVGSHGGGRRLSKCKEGHAKPNPSSPALSASTYFRAKRKKYILNK
jgi:hypothetical protein